MADLMNPGGGLTNSKLLLADANPRDVVSPKKFYSNGDKNLKTGTITERAGVVDAPLRRFMTDICIFGFRKGPIEPKAVQKVVLR